MLELDHLTLQRGVFRLTAAWSVSPGSRIAIVGPSGAGKSSLLAAIAGFLPPASGTVRWKGQDLAGSDPGRRPLTILFQEQNLFPHLTVAQNVGLGLRPDLRLTAQDQTKLEQTLERVGLSGLAARRAADLSGGQASRVALARALVRARPMLLLDEPFAALGPAQRQDMLHLVRQVADETAALVLLVTHDLKEAEGLEGLTVFVEAGVAAPPVPTDALLANPPPALRAYLGLK